jgi:hypothetical protein
LVGLVGSVIGLFVLKLLKIAERYIRQDRQATLVLVGTCGALSGSAITAIIGKAGFRVVNCNVAEDRQENRQTLRCDLQWRALPDDLLPPAFISAFSEAPGVLGSEWCVSPPPS